MKVALLQFDSVWQDTQANLTGLSKQLAKVCETPCDVVILPELFHGGFSMQPEKFAEPEGGVVSETLAQLAQQYAVTIVAGVAQLKANPAHAAKPSQFFNNALVFDAMGQQQAVYSKQKCFRYANEQHSYQAGKQPCIVTLAGEPFALFICYDLRFPELFRQVAKGVKGIIVLANWPNSRQKHWQALLTARAIENQCFVIGVNRIGKDGNGLVYEGGSTVVSPLGEVLALANATTHSLNAHLDLEQVNRVRLQYPFLNDMHH